ncbi:hypothetical protein CKAN_02244800 [Cinnamomum micranthum f. kanehirae]|uniref:Uncharacterized protein n=2 Tax=Cinnamomum micranthum f. kanehirae TaxID=337451 RepID=A0A3S3NDY4_9MAGN|nr:hypothetical protein CKAN_02244800 [Cinnamomum micranthum f. kanehirae]
MAPAQMLFDPEQQQQQQQPIKMEAPTKSVAGRENGNFNDDDDGDVDLRCTNNCEDNTFDMDISPDKHKVYEAGDTMVDIVDCAADTSARVNQDGDPDATEYSSSFGNTMSGGNGADNGLNSNLSEAEVESRFDDVASTLFDGLDEMLRPRKRKLTAHWRKYIRPLMWRCKWIELRVKEFQSQALKYDKELEAYSHRKQYKLEPVGSDNSAARLVPLSRQSYRKQVMKRKKRKRVEDTSDLPSYMSHHSLFSYYEKKKSEVDGASIDDEYGNQVNAVVQDANTVDEYGVNYEWPVLEPRVSDDSLEQILWNIEVLQSRVFKIKTQINKLVSKYARKFSSMDNLSLLMPADQPCGSAQSPAFSPAQGDEMHGGALYTAPGHISEYETGDVIMQESVSSFGEAASLPDIIDSTVGLLSSVDVTHDGPQHGDSCADVRSFFL